MNLIHYNKQTKNTSDYNLRCFIFIINILVEGVNRVINYLNLRLRAASDFFLRLTKMPMYTYVDVFTFVKII